jgi:hypothetical protein
VGDQTIILAIIGTGLVLVLVSMFLPRLVKQKGQGAAEEKWNVPDDVRALERVEESTLKLEESARELFGRLDTKARMLIRLIEEAEVTLKRLEEQAGERPAGEPTHPGVDPDGGAN